MSGATLHPLLAERWSPRGFDSSHSMSLEQVHLLLEAARWAPSSGNSQPWRFIAARRGEPAFERVLRTLSARNRRWAADASALIVVVAETLDDDRRPRRFAAYDVGGAVAHLTVQAQAEGLAVCQIGGFDAAAAAAEFTLDPALTPFVVVAVGAAAPRTGLDGSVPLGGRPGRWRKPLEDLLLPVDAEARRSA